MTIPPLAQGLTIRAASPHAPGVAALIAAHHRLMDSLFPAEDNHYIGAAELAAPHVTFLLASDGATPLGMGALANEGTYGEVKSLFTSDAARGRGVGRAILGALEAEARRQRLPALRLETGTTLDAATRLYRRGGFTDCAPFGAYRPSANSRFFEKTL